MNTIVVYLDNIFAGLPRTSEMEHLKQELLTGMEEKYVELKRDGKSEHEAIGIIISEFGSLEELTTELGIGPNRQRSTVPLLTKDEVYGYADTIRSSGFWTGLGVLLCACGVALLITLSTWYENNTINEDRGSMLGMVGMFMLVAIAVGMFIHSGMKLERYKYLEHSFQIPHGIKMELQRSQVLFAPTYRLSLITGVCLCILSPVFIFATSFVNEDFAAYGVAGFLLFIGVAVFLFVYYGNIKSAYTKLLE